jgi:hypothetical protein
MVGADFALNQPLDPIRESPLILFRDPPTREQSRDGERD